MTQVQQLNKILNALFGITIETIKFFLDHNDHGLIKGYCLMLYNLTICFQFLIGNFQNIVDIIFHPELTELKKVYFDLFLVTR